MNISEVIAIWNHQDQKCVTISPWAKKVKPRCNLTVALRLLHFQIAQAHENIELNAAYT